MNDVITETLNINNTMLDVLVSPKRKVGRPKTKITLKRVVLLNGQPVGRGRPTTDGKQSRAVVYVPVNESYSVSIHGVGKKYVSGLSQYKVPIRRVDMATYKRLVTTTK